MTEEAALAFALGFGLRSYAFKKYKTKASRTATDDETEASRTTDTAPAAYDISRDGARTLARRFEKSLSAVSKGVYFARDLVNEPANVLTPPEFTGRLRALETYGAKG